VNLNLVKASVSHTMKPSLPPVEVELESSLPPVEVELESLACLEYYEVVGLLLFRVIRHRVVVVKDWDSNVKR